jgi:hypothetical protein
MDVERVVDLGDVAIEETHRFFDADERFVLVEGGVGLDVSAGLTCGQDGSVPEPVQVPGWR